MRTLHTIPHKILFFTLALILSACGSDSGTPDQAISGGVIKGPLVNATVNVYALDTTQPSFKGAVIDSGNPIYATPLTTMALAIAINNSTSTTSADDFLAKLPAAANQVVATVGFGMSSSIDIFTTPAVLDNTVDTAQEQSDVLAYRTALVRSIYQANKSTANRS